MERIMEKLSEIAVRVDLGLFITATLAGALLSESIINELFDIMRVEFIKQGVDSEIVDRVLGEIKPKIIEFGKEDMKGVLK